MRLCRSIGEAIILAVLALFTLILGKEEMRDILSELDEKNGETSPRKNETVLCIPEDEDLSK